MSKCKVIAVANQKGGVGKTTTTFNLGVGLARMGKRVALIDCDPQGDLTICCGYPNNDEIDTTIATLMKKIINDEEIEPDEGIIHQPEGVDLLPANIELSSMDLQLVSTMNRERILSMYLNTVKSKYDYILLDCMPSLGMITINAFTAADSVIIPVQAHYLPLKGMTQLKKSYNYASIRFDRDLLDSDEKETKFADDDSDYLILTEDIEGILNPKSKTEKKETEETYYEDNQNLNASQKISKQNHVPYTRKN